MEVPVTADVLKYKQITVTVLDKNAVTKDTWMSQGQFSLRKLGSLAGKPKIVSHTVRLRDQRGQLAGKVVVDAELLPLPDIAEGGKDAAASAAALQSVGVLSLLECSVSKVPETSMLGGKQDLQVKLVLAGWKHATPG
jgi:hypothetical protein